MRIIYLPISLFLLLTIIGCSQSKNESVENIDDSLETFQELQYQNRQRIRDEYLEKFNIPKAKTWITRHFRNQITIDTIWYDSDASARLKITGDELNYLNLPNTLIRDCNDYVTFIIEGRQGDYTIKYGLTLERKGDSYSILREHVLPSDF